MGISEAARRGLDEGRAAGHRKRQAAAEERKRRGVLVAGEKRPDGTKVLSRNEELARGIIKVRQLDDEELARHTCRNYVGTFEGVWYQHSPKLIAEMDAELLKRGADLTRGAYTKAIQRLVAMLDHTDARVAVMAVDRVMERVSGKVPDKLLSADVTPYAEAHSEIAAELARALGYELPATTPDASGAVIQGEVVDGATQGPVQRDVPAPKRKAKPARDRSRSAKRHATGAARRDTSTNSASRDAASNGARRATKRATNRKAASDEPIDISKYL